MGEVNDTVQTPARRKRVEGRLLTFIVQNEKGISLLKITTTAFSISTAWTELEDSGKVNSETQQCLGVIKGHHDLITRDELKKPTYQQLAKEIAKLKERSKS